MVRSAIFVRNGKIVTSSRGGKNYDTPATYILNDPCIKAIFELYPEIILDGELYIHGKPLNYISGLCRLKDLDPKHEELRFYCYDIVDESKIFMDVLGNSRRSTWFYIMFGRR